MEHHVSCRGGFVMFKRMSGSLAPQLPQLHPPLWSEVSGDDFAGRAMVIARGEAVEVETEGTTPTRDLLVRLSKLTLTDPKEIERRDDLVGILRGTLMEAETFLAEAMQSRNEVLTSELEEVRKQGRAQLKL